MVVLTYKQEVGSNFITFSLWDKIFFDKYKDYILENSSRFKPLEEITINQFCIAENKVLENTMKNDVEQFMKDLKFFK